jgi:hypothetical protein
VADDTNFIRFSRPKLVVLSVIIVRLAKLFEQLSESRQQISFRRRNMSTALILLSEFQKTEIELWKPVVGITGYEVSNLGRVRSFIQQARGKGRRPGFVNLRKEPRPMKLAKKRETRGYYLQVALSTDFGERMNRVHVMVAEAFLINPNPVIFNQVNHKNAVKWDNRLANLEWSNHDLNHEHVDANGMRPAGEQHGRAKLTNETVRAIKLRLLQGVRQREIVREFGLSKECVSRIATGRNWKSVNV